MKLERKSYSMSALDDCEKKIKGLRTTVRIKSQHPWMCSEVSHVCDYCYDRTGCLLFDIFSGCYREYWKLVNENSTKKEMDLCLKRCVHELQWTIEDIRRDIEHGEIDAIE